MAPNTDSRPALTIACSFVSELWRSELNAPLVAKFDRAELGAAYRDCGGLIPQSSLDDLAADYCQLFVGPQQPVSPCQSIWLEGRHEGQAAVSMRQFIGLFNQPPQWWKQLPSDHFAIQLDLIGQLWEVSQNEPTFIEAVHQFEATHLRWAPKLFSAVRNRAQTAFYRGLADVTEGLLANLIEEAHSSQAGGGKAD